MPKPKRARSTRISNLRGLARDVQNDNHEDVDVHDDTDDTDDHTDDEQVSTPRGSSIMDFFGGSIMSKILARLSPKTRAEVNNAAGIAKVCATSVLLHHTYVQQVLFNMLNMQDHT